MKRITRSVLVALVSRFSFGLAQRASGQLGIVGGRTFTSTDDLTGGDAEAALNNQTGDHLGLVYDRPLGSSSIRPGRMYCRVGTYIFPVGNVQFEDDAFSLTAGGGAELGTRTGVRILPDLRYEFAATVVFQVDVEFAGPEFNSEHEPRLRTLNLRLHRPFERVSMFPQEWEACETA